MGNTIIPHTFVAGTKAKASEVNENFIAVKDAIEKKAEDIGDALKPFYIADAQEDTQAVSKSQLETAKTEMSNLINTKGSVYCLKSGNCTNGKADLFSFEDLVVSSKICGDNYPELIITALDGHAIVKESLNTINMAEKSDGTYNIFIPEEGDAYALKNTVYIQGSAPESPLLNDIWVNSAQEPLAVKKYHESKWQDFSDILAGRIVIEEALIKSVETIPYNQNGYFLNSESFIHKTEFTSSVVNLAMPDYTAGISKPLYNWHKAEKNGWIYAYGCINSQNVAPLTVFVGTSSSNYITMASSYTGAGANDGHSAFIAVPKGFYYYVAGISLVFYPCKGEK